MASIKISDLRPSDFDLLGDCESFLDDLSDNDLTTVNGGSFFFGLIVGLIITIVETNNIVEAPVNDSELGDVNSRMLPTWYVAAFGKPAVIGFFANK